MTLNTRHTSGNKAQKPPKMVFFAATIVIFFLSLSAADSIGFVPDYIDGTTPITEAQASTDTLALSDLPMLGEDAVSADGSTANTPAATTALPSRIKIPAIGMDLAVQNPKTTDVDALDALLQQGPARYTLSAKLGQEGNMIIFAHSSHLPIVHNQMFRAFNKVPELTAGDLITIEGTDGKSYLYSVTSVRKADASDATIDMSPSLGTKLTLVTCDTLTGKSARFILSADFIGIAQ